MIVYFVSVRGVRKVPTTVKSRQSAPTSSTLQVGRGGLPHSVLHEKVLTLRKLFVHLVHRPKVKSQESYRPDKTQGLCDPWSGGWALLRTFPTGSSTRLQCSTASQTATESCKAYNYSSHSTKRRQYGM